MPFIEDDIAHHAHVLGQRIKDSIGLGALCLADKDTRCAMVIQLAELVQVIDIGQAAESPQMPHRRRTPMPCLVGVLPCKLFSLTD